MTPRRLVKFSSLKGRGYTHEIPLWARLVANGCGRVQVINIAVATVATVIGEENVARVAEDRYRDDVPV